MSENQRPEYSARLRQVIAEANMTQAQLADAVGVKQVAVGYWLNRGSIPYRRTLERVCAVLEVNREWLLEGKGSRAAIFTPDTLRRLPRDILADLAILGEAAMKSDEKRQMIAHLAHVFRSK